MSMSDIKWIRHSKFERSCSYAGRHFFAVRCANAPKVNGLMTWKIEELDRPLATGTKVLGTVALGIGTSALSASVVAVCAFQKRTVGVELDDEYYKSAVGRIGSASVKLTLTSPPCATHATETWKLDGSNGHTMVVRAHNNETVCRMAHASTIDDLNKVVAAPAMLAAIKKLVADHERVKEIMLQEAGVGLIDQTALAEAKAAIAQAEGRSS